MVGGLNAEHLLIGGYLACARLLIQLLDNMEQEQCDLPHAGLVQKQFLS